MAAFVRVGRAIARHLAAAAARQRRAEHLHALILVRMRRPPPAYRSGSHPAAPRPPGRLIPSSQTTSVTPDRPSTSRSSRAAAEGPPWDGWSGVSLSGPEDLVAGDPLVHHHDMRPVHRVQAAGQHIRPAVVAVQGRGGTVGDAVAQRHDHAGARRDDRIRRVQEIPARGAVRIRAVILQLADGPGIGRGDVGGGHRRRVPGHRPAVAGNMEGDGELAPGHLDAARIVDEGQEDRIRPHLSARRHGHALLAGEGQRPVGARRDRRTAHLQPCRR